MRILAGSALAVAIVLPAYAAPVSSATAPAPVLSASTSVAVDDGLTPINGGPKGRSAAAVKVGRYLDKTEKPNDGEFHFNVYKVKRTVANSTIQIGITLRPEKYVAGQRLQGLLGYPDPKNNKDLIICRRLKWDANSRPQVMPLATQTFFSNNAYKECGSRKELLFGFTAGEESRVPEGTPYEFSVAELPPVTNLSKLPYPSAPDWEDLPLDTDPTVSSSGGASMPEAVVLGASSTTHVDLPLGRPVWFAVPLKERDHLQAVAETTVGEEAGFGAALELRIAGPLGGLVNTDEASTAPPPYTSSTNLTKNRTRVSAISWRVSPRNMSENSDYYSSSKVVTSAGMPGYYYMVLYAQKLPNAEVDSIPVTLYSKSFRVVLYGDSPAPVYKGKAPAFPAPVGGKPKAYDPSDEPTDEPTESPTDDAGDDESDEETGDASGEATSESDRNEVLWGLGGIGLGLLGVGLISAIVLLLQRRRT
jgi:hypothetical protein